MELIKKSAYSPELSTIERVIAEAKNEPKCRELNELELALSMNMLITLAYNNLRWSFPEPNELAQMSEALAIEVKNYFLTLTISELKIAVNEGCNGFHGEFSGMSKATVCKWFNSFMQSQNRLEAIKKQQRFLKEPEKVLEENEKFELMKDLCLNLFEEFKKNRKVNDVGNSNYNFIDKLGLIRFTKEKKIEQMKVSQAKLLVQNSEKLKTELVKNIRLDIQKNIDSIKLLNSEVVVIEAKKCLLNEYFKGLTDLGIELKDEINNCKK